jgi:ligand-binding sensor domain-containing protein/signal transduction histidine kinase
MPRPLLYLLFFLLLVQGADGQLLNLEFERYNNNDGLSQNHVFAIAQDHLGFLWFGTDDGLNRFDGHEFKVFKYNDADTTSIIDNSIRALLVAKDSSIWIGTNGGICRYFPNTEKIVRYFSDYTDPTKLSGSQVSSIVENDDGRIWISYIGDGIDVITPGKKEILHYTINRNDEFKIRNDLVSSFIFMPNGDVVIGTLGGLQVINSEGNVINDSVSAVVYPWIAGVDPTISDMILSRDKKSVWIATELNGVYKVNLLTSEISNFSKSNGRLDYNHTSCLMEDSEQNVWIGSEVIYFLQKDREELFSIREYGIQESEVVKNPIYSLFEDRDKNIWLGTQRMGVLKYNPQNKQVLRYHTNMGEGSITSDQVISFAQADERTLWVGTDGEGLFRFDMRAGKFKQHPLQSKFSSKVIKTIYKEASGTLWLGTWDGGFMKIDDSGKTVEIFNPEKKNFESHHVWDIEPDSLGNLWLGTLRDGLCHFSPKTKKYSYLRMKAGDPSALINNDVMTLLVDSRNNLWVGTANGLSVLKPGKTDFINFYSDGSDNNLSGNVIQSLYEDRLGNIWVGTNGGGITIFSRNFRIIKVVKEKQGLPSNTVTSLQADLHDNLWASTYKGLVKINYRDFSIGQLPHIGGLREKEYSSNASFSTSDGRLIFGGSTGIDFFHPDSLDFPAPHEKIIFTSLKIFNDPITPFSNYHGRKIIDRSITVEDQVDLSHTDYSFTLTFAPLTYNWQRTIQYAYFMENLDREWQYTTSDRRFVHYSNLTPGNYLLKVKASFDGQHWSENIKTLSILIHPPWWDTMIFKISSGLFAFASIFVIYKVRVNFLERQKQKLGQLVEVRTGELKKSNDELQDKNEKIETQHYEIQILLQELAKQKDDIEQKNEELQSQHDTLAVKSSALEKAQSRLQEINANLEHLIERRTSKLNTAVRELETFLYRASHDLRGPISSMLGLIRVAELENGQRDQVYINFLRKTTVRLERTLGKLVQKHTIQKSKIIPELISKESLVDILGEICLDIPHYRGHDFQVEICDSLHVQSDRAMLVILLTNLLENAFFFSEHATDRTVKLEVTQCGSAAIFSILDFGPGIKDDLKDKIYTMFYRGHEMSAGNGLGLYLVQNALLRINGKIELETAEDRFTRFTMTLEPL